MKTIALNAQMREGLGKSNSKKLRSEGFVPAIFYGYQTDAIAIKVDSSELISALVGDRDEAVFVKLGIQSDKGKKVQKLSVIKDLQIDAIKRKPVHVDFYEIRMDRTLTVDVPVIFSGTPIGVEAGGELQQLRRTVKVSGLPSDLPESVEIDISDLNIGDSVKVDTIAVKEEVQILESDDVAIVSVVPTRTTLITQEGEEEEVTEDAASASEDEEKQDE